MYKKVKLFSFYMKKLDDSYHGLPKINTKKYRSLLFHKEKL